ncbi:MAG: carbohydrate ABC transporter permease [Clostridiales bacterium]|nr:carbohydrate ABC transporter permease [Clostridiales bacterium]MBQ2768668.1 carbohydrate ABC transporter permease [Clostridia bacterium]
MNIKKTITKILHHLVLILLLVMVLIPFYILIINSLKLDKHINQNPLSFPGSMEAPLYFGSYEYAWDYVQGYIFNTVAIAVLEIFGVLLFASLAAYGFTRFHFKGKEALFTVFLAFMMIPSILTLAPQYALVYRTLNLKQSYAGIVLPAIAGGMPVNIFLIKTFFSGVPDSLFEAAELDGASHIRRYTTLALPLCMPILFTIGLSTLLGAWNDVIWARLILYGNEELYTISVGVFVVFNDATNKIPDNVVYAGYCIASLPLIIAFAFTSKQFIKGLTNGAIKM